MIKYAVDDDRIATITFDRDDKRNAVNKQMAAQILQKLDHAERHEVRVIVLRANPHVDVWCAGHDLTELVPHALQTDNPTLEIVAKIQSTPLPVIAMVEGNVYAGGLLILLSADIVVATHDSRVAITSNKLGIPLDPELYAHWLRVMGLHKVKELLFTASTISAEDARRTGLFNHAVQRDQLESTTYEIARKILTCTPEGVANAKHQLNLIAQQSALSDAELDDARARNAKILKSPQTEARIKQLLASLQRKE